jgi:hypothetical protein
MHELVTALNALIWSVPPVLMLFSANLYLIEMFCMLIRVRIIYQITSMIHIMECFHFNIRFQTSLRHKWASFPWGTKFNDVIVRKWSNAVFVLVTGGMESILVVPRNLEDYQPSLVQSSVSTTSTSKQHGCDAPRPLLLLVQTSVLPAALAYCTSWHTSPLCLLCSTNA